MDHEATVRRLVDEAVNGENQNLIDELFTPDMTAWAREWFGSFRRSGQTPAGGAHAVAMAAVFQ